MCGIWRRDTCVSRHLGSLLSADSGSQGLQRVKVQLERSGLDIVAEGENVYRGDQHVRVLITTRVVTKTLAGLCHRSVGLVNDLRQRSPPTVVTSVVVIMVGPGWPSCARARPWQACGLPAFPVPRARSGHCGHGWPAGRCVARLRPEGRPLPALRARDHQRRHNLVAAGTTSPSCYLLA
jgi:hypothetical protein